MTEIEQAESVERDETSCGTLIVESEALGGSVSVEADIPEG